MTADVLAGNATADVVVPGNAVADVLCGNATADVPVIGDYPLVMLAGSATSSSSADTTLTIVAPAPPWEAWLAVLVNAGWSGAAGAHGRTATFDGDAMDVYAGTDFTFAGNAYQFGTHFLLPPPLVVSTGGSVVITFTGDIPDCKAAVALWVKASGSGLNSVYSCSPYCTGTSINETWPVPFASAPSFSAHQAVGGLSAVQGTWGSGWRAGTAVTSGGAVPVSIDYATRDSTNTDDPVTKSGFADSAFTGISCLVNS